MNVVLVCSLLVVACGKRGPPLPPLVKLPVAPVNLTAARRGDTVDLQLTVPSANTDNTRPANVARVDVYAFTGPVTVADADVLKRGIKVASVAVKSPRDPEATTDPDDPELSEADLDPPEGEGLDQGAAARIQETLTAASRALSDVGSTRSKPRQVAGDIAQPLMYPGAAAALVTPLLGPPPATSAARTYMSVGVTKKGRRGPVSRRVVVPLVPPPAAPTKPDVTYTETEVAVTWRPPPSVPVVQEPATGNVLPSRLIGIAVPRMAYNVYEVIAPSVETESSVRLRLDATSQDTPLTKTPIAETQYADSRVTWGANRCYGVRTAEIVDSLVVESDQTPSTCVKLIDTFPPMAPKGLNAVASGEGAINLIWDANTEPDLNGYIVLRAAAPNAMLIPITPAPIHETSFRDSGQIGVQYIYALQAVDTAGNASLLSDRVEETAR